MIIFHYISKLSIHIIYIYISCFSRSVNEKKWMMFHIWYLYIYLLRIFSARYINWYIYIFSAQTSIFSVNYSIISIYDIYIYIIHILYIKYYTSYIIYKMFQWYLSIYIYIYSGFFQRDILTDIYIYIYIQLKHLYFQSIIPSYLYMIYIYILYTYYI